MANANGGHGGGQNAAIYNNNNSNTNNMNMPAAGHYSDMQALMQSMDTLASLLQQNRKDFQDVQEGLERVERVRGTQVNSTHSSGLENGNSPTTTAATVAADPNVLDTSTTSVTSLRRELDAARLQIAMLEQRSRDHITIQGQYEEVLEDARKRAHDYVSSQTEYINQLHQHYVKVIDNAREETITAQMIHQGWQASLARLNEQLKLAMQAKAKEKDPYRRRLAMLQEENRVMREKLGWEKVEWDSDEEQTEGVNDKNVLQSAQPRGRPLKPVSIVSRERIVPSSAEPANAV